MKSYRNAIAALVLAFVLSTSAFAGDGIIHTDRTPPPPPPQTNGIIWAGLTTPPPPPPPQANSVIYTDRTAPASEGDALTEIALTMLQSVLSLI